MMSNLLSAILVFFVALSASKAASVNTGLEEGEGSRLVGVVNGSRERLLRRDSNEEVMAWLTQEVMPMRSQNRAKKLLMDGVEGYISIARGAVYVMLGYNLAHSVFGLQEGAQREIVSGLYGGLAAIPMALLGSISSRQFIEDTNTFIERCFTNKRESEKAIEKPFMKRAAKFGAKLLFIGTPALISSSTITNLAREEFNPSIGNFWWIFGAPNLFVRALMDYEKIPLVWGKIRNYGHIGQFIDRTRSCMGLSNERRYQENRVKQYLLESKAYLSSLDDVAIRGLLDVIESGGRDLNTLFSGRKETIKETTGETLTGATLAAVSFAGLWVYYPLTVGAFNTLLEGFGVDQNASSFSAWSNALASVALSSASAIITVGGYETGKKCWSLFKAIGSGCAGLSGNVKSYIRGSLSTFLAGCTASTAYSIYYDWPIDNKGLAMLVLTTAITSQFTLSAWAVDGALTKYSMSKNCKEPLLSKIDTIIRKLPDISDEHLRALEEILPLTHNV